MINNIYNFPLFSWHLELASKCALECPRCPRTGAENKAKYNVTEMPIEKLKAVFSPELLKSKVKKILLCGGHGDPIYYSKLFEFISYVKNQNEYIEITLTTNGSHRKEDWWKELSSLLSSRDIIVFSIDGWDHESNIKYRKGSDFQSIMLGIETVLKGQVTVNWSTIVFSFNQDKLPLIENLAKEKGVHYFNLVRSTKFGQNWADENGIDLLKPREEFLIDGGPYNRAMISLNPRPVQYHNLQPAISVREISIGQLKPRCLSGNGTTGLYIDASGFLYPCCWISHPFDIPMKPNQQNIWLTEKSRFNVFGRGLESVLNDKVWEDFFATWLSENEMYATCKEKCSC